MYFLLKDYFHTSTRQTPRHLPRSPPPPTYTIQFFRGKTHITMILKIPSSTIQFIERETHNSIKNPSSSQQLADEANKRSQPNKRKTIDTTDAGNYDEVVEAANILMWMLVGPSWRPRKATKGNSGVEIEYEEGDIKEGGGGKRVYA